jgi:hypothetical protein
VTDETLRQWVPIGISFVSLILSVFALGWNVYRDVIFRARVKVAFAVVRQVTMGAKASDGPQFIKIGVTNHGPGPVRIEMIVGKSSSVWKRLTRDVEHFFILVDYTNPLNPRLPAKIEVGDTLTLFLPHNESSLLNGTATHIGVSDSFGRSHFAPRKHLEQAKTQFRKDFPDAKPRLRT